MTKKILDLKFPGHDKKNKQGPKPKTLNDVMADEFSSKTNLTGSEALEKAVIQNIDISDIDEYEFNPRKITNHQYQLIKESIQNQGLLQRISVSLNPETKRYELINGGNTRLRCLKELWKELEDTKYYSIECNVEPWEADRTKTQTIIAHLIENEARGDLVLVDKAKTLLELEIEFRNSISNGDKKSPQTLRTFDHQKTKLFLEYLKENGYSVGESSLLVFRFTATKLVGHLDKYLNLGLGSPQVIKIRSVYNNLKRLVKESKALSDQYNNDGVDVIFGKALSKYKAQEFNFDTLLEKIVTTLFEDIYLVFEPNGGISDFKQELLHKKQNKKEEPKITVEDKGNNDDSTIEEENINIEQKNKTTKENQELAEIDTSNDSNLNNDKDEQDSSKTEIETETKQTIEPVTTANTDIQEMRQECFDLASEIFEHFGIKNITKISEACGFIITSEEGLESFDEWMIFYSLLALSSAADPQQNIPPNSKVLQEEKMSDDMRLVYLSENKSAAIDNIVKKSNLITPVPTVIISFKNKLPVNIWQKLSQLESVCFQINKQAQNENNSIWN